MKTSNKMIIAIVAMLLGLVTIMSTSCSTQKHTKPCSAYLALPITGKYVKHNNDFATKKRYHLNHN